MSEPARRTRVVALTPRGGALARDLAQALPRAGCWLPRPLAAGDPKVQTFDRVATVFQEAFQRGENLVCIMAAGLVVRGIAPHLQGKDQDPGGGGGGRGRPVCRQPAFRSSGRGQ